MNSLIEYLPAIYQDPSDGGAPADQTQFLPQYLNGFERVLLTGARDAPSQFDQGRPATELRKQGSGGDIDPLENEITSLHLLFDPERTPERFLSWLAGWVALSLRADLSPRKQRKLVADIAGLYRIRGTRRYVEEILRLYLDALPSVTDEDVPGLQVGVHSTAGVDTYLGGGPSFLFRVTLAFSRNDPGETEKQRQLARDVIELERPAHTRYELKAIFPKVRVGIHSTVGVDTVLAP